jgi:putative addiction module component (TIGR02574 family)
LTPETFYKCRQRYNHGMTQAAEEILQKALELPEKDRERIADALLLSVHASDEAAFEEEWGPEIQRRISEIDEGKVEMRPWDETLDRLEKRLVR